MTVADFPYETLTPERRREIAQARLSQYEAEHYSQSLNLRALERASDLPEHDKQAQLEQLRRTLASIEASIALHREELASLDGAGPPDQ